MKRTIKRTIRTIIIFAIIGLIACVWSAKEPEVVTNPYGMVAIPCPTPTPMPR